MVSGEGDMILSRNSDKSAEDAYKMLYVMYTCCGSMATLLHTFSALFPPPHLPQALNAAPYCAIALVAIIRYYTVSPGRNSLSPSSHTFHAGDATTAFLPSSFLHPPSSYPYGWHIFCPLCFSECGRIAPMLAATCGRRHNAGDHLRESGCQVYRGRREPPVVPDYTGLQRSLC